MNKKILIACYEVPGFGGASSVAYKLFEKMQEDGYDVCYLNLINELDNEYFQYIYGYNYGNPKNLNSVFNALINRKIFQYHENLSEIISEIKADLMVGVGYIAANLLRRACNDIKVIYLTTGCTQVKQYLKKDTSLTASILEYKIDSKSLFPKIYNFEEKYSVSMTDLTITHSELVKKLYDFYYPPSKGKIYSRISWFNEYICNEVKDYVRYSRNFIDREIDALFVASNWDRLEKNLPLVVEIVTKSADLNIHILGECNERINNAKHHGLVKDKDYIYKLMGNSKTVVSTSRFDAAPGVLFEGSVMGCNLIASKNCGNWMICNDDLLIKNYCPSEFIEKINISVIKKYYDNMDYFIQRCSYDDLLETINLF